jgi:hypothetical protein
MKMSKYASKVIEQAKKWIGKKEADGTHKAIIDVYNANKPLARNYKVKYTDEWCATFVSAVAIKCGYTDIIPTECSCQKMIALFKEIGCFKENENRTPVAGDIIFYDWQDDGRGDNKGWADHVGIVEKVANGKITVIEGNYNCEVKRRTIAVNGKYIRGFGVPKYDKEPEKTTSGANTNKINGAYTGNSIVDYLVSIKQPSDFESRRKLAAKYGIKDYTGTATQNAKLLKLLKSGAAPQNNVSSTQYYPKYTGNSSKIDTVFKEIGVPATHYGSWARRKPIASKNGIGNYTGTATQNSTLVSLARRGALKKV